MIISSFSFSTAHKAKEHFFSFFLSVSLFLYHIIFLLLSTQEISNLMDLGEHTHTNTSSVCSSSSSSSICFLFSPLYKKNTNRIFCIFFTAQTFSILFFSFTYCFVFRAFTTTTTSSTTATFFAFASFTTLFPLRNNNNNKKMMKKALSTHLPLLSDDQL